MRNNSRMLGVAIAATLSLQVGVAQAMGFENVNDTHKTALASDVTAGGHVLTDAGVPGPAFDGVTSDAVVPVPVDGIVYATELFGGSGPPSLPKDAMAAALYTLSLGDPVKENLKVIFTLTGGVWASEPKLAISDAAHKFEAPLTNPIEGGQAGDESVTFLVAATDSQPLDNDDQLMFVYQFKETSLGTEGNEVKLEAQVLYLNGKNVNPKREIPVATSKPAVTTSLSSETDGVIKISVEKSSKKFTGNNTGAHISDQIAQIGFISVTNVNNSPSIMTSDGKTRFEVGGTGDGNVKTGEGSTLTITGGQFVASKADGAVYLCDWSDNATCPNITGGTATVNEEGTAATFALDNAKLEAITTAGKVAIRMAVNGSTPIEAVSDNPTAVLKIDFDDGDDNSANDYVIDIETQTAPPDGGLRKIDKDGTVCVVYNVPSSEVAVEKINIRITNDSGASGKLTGILYKDDGTELGSGTLTEDLGPGKTTTLQAGDLESLLGTGGPWTGRAMLEITSTLPRMEVLALMRNQVDRSLLTNLSVGASGKSCAAQ